MSNKNDSSPREKTKEEVRNELLDLMRHNARYWSEQQNISRKQMCDGLARSMLIVFDGLASLPAFLISVDPHDEDKDYCIERGENWYPAEMSINDTGKYLRDLY